MYNKYALPLDNQGRVLKHYHHIKVDPEFLNDANIWKLFLEHANSQTLTRPFIDFSSTRTTFDANQICFYTDSSANKRFGFGCYFDKEWTFGKWEENYITVNKPSIEYLELYALVVGIYTWQNKLKNARYIIFCDNESVVHMVNSGVSKCANCMYLLRMLTLNNLLHHRRIFVQHVSSKDNFLADSLSRLKFNSFFRRAPKDVSRIPEKLPEELWPASRIWQRK